MKNRIWMKSKYEKLKEASETTYAFVNMKIKRLRIINYMNSKSYGDSIIQAVHQAVENYLEKDEYIAKVSSCSFDILLKVNKNSDDNDILKRFNEIDDCLDNAENGKFKGVIYCGFGMFYMSEYDVDFETAEYFAEISRSQSPENPHLGSHLNIYGHDFIDKNLTFATLKKDFYDAFHQGDIKIYLQPKVNLKTGEVTSAEALIRWIDKEKGMIPIADYLPVLEENGLTSAIDKLAFEQACQCIRRWKTRYDKEIRISTNISKNTFGYWLFFDEFKDIYDLYRVPKHCIEIELLESIVLNQEDRVQHVVNEIKAFGFSCSLDDFGSGFSSYSVLTETNLDVLKIDRSLFKNFNNEREKVSVRHIVEIGHELNMEIVAEGVEGEAYVDYLRSLDCEYVQGFYFYHPMSIEEFERKFVKGNEKISFSSNV